MCPTTAFEQPMPGGLRASFPNGNRGGASLLGASGQIQGQQLTANSDFEFDSAPPVEAPPYAVTENQNGHYETAIHATMPNMLGFPQAGTVAHAPVWTPLPHPPTEQGWHNGPAAHANMQSELGFPFQGSTNHNSFPNGYGQDTANGMLGVGNASEAIDFLGSLSGAAGNTGMNSSINNFYQPSNTTYGTSAPSQELSPHPNLSPEASFSSTASSPLNFTPSPTNVSSPNSTSTRHPCSHCTKTFVRKTDAWRHEKTHFPEQSRIFPCNVQGCRRNGERAFTRSDKLMEHRRTVHGLWEGGY